MSNTYSLLQLHLSQARQALYRASNNCYADNRKQIYQNKLKELYQKVFEEVQPLKGLSDDDIYNKYKVVIDFIFKSLEFLDSSTLNQSPYEIVECLNCSMLEWQIPADSFIIVTSLINSDGFSFEPSLAFNEQLYNDINARYNIEFSHRLVQINLPKRLSRDYLSCVVLYHELGHFIDMRHKFMETAHRIMIKAFNDEKYIGADCDELLLYFPYLPNLNDPKLTERKILSNSRIEYFILNHLMEYFCDIFAAQYVGESSNHFLKYITKATKQTIISHPSTTNRIKVVEDFLSGTPNIVVEICKDATDQILNKPLTISFDNISKEDFFKLLPVEIASTKQLHGLFFCAWDIWLNNRAELLAILNLDETENGKLYAIINNLVEKSIGNYITLNRWKEAQK